MRMIALSIVILAGTIMASAGVIANALPSVRYYNDLPLPGLLLAGIATIMLIIEWWPMPRPITTESSPKLSTTPSVPRP
jgi:hypothetical protein